MIVVEPAQVLVLQEENVYYIHGKKRLAIFPSLNYSRPLRVWLVTSRPRRVWLVTDIPAGDEKIAYLFYSLTKVSI